MKFNYSFFCAIVLVLFSFSCALKTKQVENKKPNVLLLYMDDLRPQLHSYGANMIQSPNIDALAASGVQFNNAYSNVAVCGASRASMLTGIRPTKSIFLNYNTFVEQERSNAITLPQLFKNNGYTTISNGKIYHHLDDREGDWDEVWRPYAFDENDKNLAPTDYWQSLWKDYQLETNAKTYKETDNGPAYEAADVLDSVYIDGRMTQKVIRDIKKLSKSKQPFFLTAGFISPHLPFNAPKKYWNLYKRENIKQPYNNYVAKDAPKISISNWPEMRAYNGIPKEGQVSDSLAITLIHGYYATVSYVDALIGDIVTNLKAEGLYENTIIILVSDHGYNLQEHTQWAKFTSHKISAHVPLIISSPKFRNKTTTEALVELVDVYPTLAELCNLEMPKEQLEGESLIPVLKDATHKGKKYIFMKSGNGYTVKSNEFGYTEYRNNNGAIIATMLYDHLNDKDENVNLSNLPEYSEIVAEFQHILNTEFKSNLEGD